MPPRTIEVDGKLKTVKVRHALTNLIGCIPKEEDEDGKPLKAGQPPKYAIEACRPRLTEIIGIVRPRLVVQVGRFSEKHAKEAATEFKGLKWVPILHPAYLLRLDISQKGLAIQRTRIAIRDAVDALFAA